MISEYIGKGNKFRDNINNMPNKLAAEGALSGFVNKLSTGIEGLTSSGITGAIPFVNVAAGLFKIFAGNESGISTTSTTFMGTITGEMTTEYSICNFTLNEPGATSGRIDLPVYNEPLGVIQIANSPQIDKRRVGSSSSENYSYRLSTLPSDFRINPMSGLQDEPQNLQIAYSFKLQARRITNPPLHYTSFLTEALQGVDFVESYKVTYSGGFPVYHCFTKFIDYEDAQHIAINTNMARILDIGVKIKAEFLYNDLSKEPFIYVGDYKPVLNDQGSGSYYAVLPSQRIQSFTENLTFSNQTFTMDTIVRIEHGATLRLENCTLNPAGSDYGFEVLNGKLELVNCNYNVGDGFIKVIGEGSEVLIESGSEIVFNEGLIALINKGKLTVDSSIISLNNSELKLKRNGIAEFVNNSQFNTTGTTKIIGFTSNYWYDPASYYNGPNPPQFGAEINVPGDRIIINGSKLNFSENTEILSGSSEKWDGLHFINCNDDDPNYVSSQLQGSISDIHYLRIDNSKLKISHSHIESIGQLKVLDNSKVLMETTTYQNNLYGIYVETSEFNSTYSTISSNGSNGLSIVNSLYPASLLNVNVINNSGTGIEIRNAFCLIRNSKILNNQKMGFSSLSSNQSIIVGDSRIGNNEQAEIIALGNAFPRFHPFPVNGRIKNPRVFDDLISDIINDRYLLMALGSINSNIDCSDLRINITNQDRFFPNIDAYVFDSPSQIQAEMIYNNSIDYIFDKDFYMALSLLKQIIEEYPETKVAKNALSLLPYIDKANNGDPDVLFSYLEQISHDNLNDLKLENKALIKISQKEYEEAIYLYDTIINNPPDELIALLAELEQAYCYYKLSESGAKHLPVNSRRKPLSFKDFSDIQQEIYNKILYNNNENIISSPEMSDFFVNNYPNPFNPTTNINFSIPISGNVNLSIYNVKGQLVKNLANQNFTAGEHTITWHGTDCNNNSLASGVYFYKLQTIGKTEIKKMLLMK